MWLLTIFVGCLFLLFDVSLLKKKSLEIFSSQFRFPPWMSILFNLFFLAALFSGEAGEVILRVVFVLLFLIYALRRNQFLKSVGALPAPESPLVVDEKLELALSTFSILGLWALVLVVISVFMDIWEQIFVSRPNELFSVLIVSELAVIALLVLIYRSVRPLKSLKFFDVLGLEIKDITPLKLWILPLFFAMGYAVVSSFVLDARPIQPMTPLQEMLNSTTSMGVLLLFVGTAILTAPFFEEVIFRGFLFYVLRPYKGLVFTVAFVALAFGVMHVDQYWGDWAAILVVGFFGLSLTCLRAWTGSTVPGMVAHYVYNTTLIVMPAIMMVSANPLYFDYQVNYYRMTSEQKQERLLECINQNPRFPDSYNDLAWIYSDENIKLDEALVLINRALELEPDNFAFWDTKAEVLYKLRRFKEAIAVAEDLVRKYPEDSYLRGQLKKFKEKNVIDN